MFELKGILPRIYREVRRSESLAGEVVKRKTKIRYDRRRSRWNKEKFAKTWWPFLRKGWFYHLRKSLG